MGLTDTSGTPGTPGESEDLAPMAPPATGRGRRPGRPRTRYWVAAAACIGAIGFLLFGGLRGNIVYYRTVPEALERKASGDTGRFRLAGAVVPGSVSTTPDGVTFRLTDGLQEITVHNLGDPPELFADGAPVVCDGHWNGDVFASEDILIRHGNDYGDDYVPPAVDLSAVSGA
jgi:cytochrome c-type biogenesis protein CcmE